MTTEATVLDAPAAPAAPVADPKATPVEAPKTEAAPATDTAPQFDWRKEIAGEDAKLAKNLERFSDLKALHKAFDDTQKALRDTGRIKLPGADATEDDLKAFAKALNIPEKPDGYKLQLNLPDGVDLDDDAKTELGKITAYLHGKGGMAAAPETVKAAQELYVELRENMQATIVANGEKAHKETLSALKKEWGGDFKNNIGYAQAAVQGLFGKEQASEILSMRLEDGTRLGDFQPFLKAMNVAGRQLAQDPLFLPTTNMTSDPKTMAARKAEIYALRNGTPAEQKQYQSPEIQQELDTILAKEIAAMSGRTAA